MRMNPDYSSEVYITAYVEAECRMISHNCKIHKEKNKIASNMNALKNSARVTKHGCAFAKLL